jgi:hypothetical protein
MSICLVWIFIYSTHIHWIPTKNKFWIHTKGTIEMKTWIPCHAAYIVLALYLWEKNLEDLQCNSKDSQYFIVKKIRGNYQMA